MNLMTVALAHPENTRRLLASVNLVVKTKGSSNGETVSWAIVGASPFQTLGRYRLISYSGRDLLGVV